MTLHVLRRRLGVPVLLVLVVLLFLAVRHPYAIPDWFRLRGYEPGAVITAIADATAMTDKAKHLFFINHPQLQDKAAFRQSCPQYDEQTIVIGCYAAGQRGIFILRVNDYTLHTSACAVRSGNGLMTCSRAMPITNSKTKES
jgi:hypothetical protein